MFCGLAYIYSLLMPLLPGAKIQHILARTGFYSSQTIPKAEQGVHHKTCWLGIYYSLYFELANSIPSGIYRDMTLTDDHMAKLVTWVGANLHRLEYAGTGWKRRREYDWMAVNGRRINTAQIILEVWLDMLIDLVMKCYDGE